MDVLNFFSKVSKYSRFRHIPTFHLVCAPLTIEGIPKLGFSLTLVCSFLPSHLEFIIIPYIPDCNYVYQLSLSYHVSWFGILAQYSSQLHPGLHITLILCLSFFLNLSPFPSCITYILIPSWNSALDAK